MQNSMTAVHWQLGSSVHLCSIQLSPVLCTAKQLLLHQRSQALMMAPLAYHQELHMPDVAMFLVLVYSAAQGVTRHAEPATEVARVLATVQFL